VRTWKHCRQTVCWLSANTVSYSDIPLLSQFRKQYHLKVTVFWVVAPCGLVEVYRCTRPLGATTQKTALHKNFKSHFMSCCWNLRCKNISVWNVFLLLTFWALALAVAHDRHFRNTYSLANVVPCFVFLKLKFFADCLQTLTKLVCKMKMAVFWILVPCSLVEVYQRQQGSLNVGKFLPTAQRYNPQDSQHHICGRENLKSVLVCRLFASTVDSLCRCVRALANR
jgi:hypothetical protein